MFEIPGVEKMGALALSPSGRRLAIASGRELVVLDVDTRRELARLASKCESQRDLVPRPDGPAEPGDRCMLGPL